MSWEDSEEIKKKFEKNLDPVMWLNFYNMYSDDDNNDANENKWPLHYI